MIRLCSSYPCTAQITSYHWRQRFCSNKCRQRAFYWRYKNTKGIRYAARRAK